MRIQSLRPFYAEDELRKIYAKPHSTYESLAHQLRVAVTVQIGHALVGRVSNGADLSCGDGVILKSLMVENRIFNDYATGIPIEKAIEEIPNVDVFVCCETLEHLVDPISILKAIRAKADRLILSTPIDAWDDDNPEHYWAWDKQCVESMMQEAGFKIRIASTLDLRAVNGGYCFGIWGVE